VTDGPGVGVGVGVTVIKSQTASNGFIDVLTLAIVGSSKVGTVEPPFKYAAVPVGEIKITLEFDASAVTQGIWQKITADGIST
jgi:hypothetical protein